MALNFLCLNCGGRGVRRDEDRERPCNVCGAPLEQWDTLEDPPGVVLSFEGPKLSSPEITAKKIAHVKKATSRKQGTRLRKAVGQEDFWDTRFQGLED